MALCYAMGMIYHCSIQSISRSQGRSACAAAAYRASEIIRDARYGVTHDYRKKPGVIYSDIIGWPGGDREKLWNAAEAAERRCDSVVAREVRIALPHHESDARNIDLCHNFAEVIQQKFGVAVDYAIHDPSDYGDYRNMHAHILITSRQVDPETGVFARLKDRSWNREKSKDTVTFVRQSWAEIYNEWAQFIGKPTISHLSYADQKIDKIPGKHLGPARSRIRKSQIEVDKENKLHFDWTSPQQDKLNEQIKDTEALITKNELMLIGQAVNEDVDEIDFPKTLNFRHYEDIARRYIDAHVEPRPKEQLKEKPTQRTKPSFDSEPYRFNDPGGLDL